MKVAEMGSGKAPKDSRRIAINKTEPVIVDMQRAFVDEGALLECLGAR